METLSHREFPIEREDDVILVRRAVKSLAQARKFDSFASAAITTATSELTRNVWVHAGSGNAVVEEVESHGRVGLRVEFQDRGPGIDDVDRVLRGGYSTARSLGLGLSGSKRLVDDFQIESQAGQGTRVVIVKWKAF
jgi:serine/threonine-protein kinase RsbT